MQRPGCARSNVKCVDVGIHSNICKLCIGYDVWVCEKQRDCSYLHKTCHLAYNYVKTSTIKLCKEIAEMNMWSGNVECTHFRMCQKQCEVHGS